MATEIGHEVRRLSLRGAGPHDLSSFAVEGPLATASQRGPQGRSASEKNSGPNDVNRTGEPEDEGLTEGKHDDGPKRGVGAPNLCLSIGTRTVPRGHVLPSPLSLTLWAPLSGGLPYISMRAGSSCPGIPIDGQQFRPGWIDALRVRSVVYGWGRRSARRRQLVATWPLGDSGSRPARALSR